MLHTPFGLSFAFPVLMTYPAVRWLDGTTQKAIRASIAVRQWWSHSEVDDETITGPLELLDPVSYRSTDRWFQPCVTERHKVLTR